MIAICSLTMVTCNDGPCCARIPALDQKLSKNDYSATFTSGNLAVKQMLRVDLLNEAAALKLCVILCMHVQEA